MKLINHNYGLFIELSEDFACNTVVVEDPDCFAIIVDQLIQSVNHNEEFFLLDNTDYSHKLADYAQVIVNPFELDFNVKKVVAAIGNEFKQKIESEEYSRKVQSLQKEYMSLMSSFKMDSDYPVEWNDIEISDLVKLAGFRINDSGCGSLVERLSIFTSVMNFSMGLDIFIFINLKNFLSEEKLELFLQECSYKKINIVLFESCSLTYKIKEEKIQIIDKDLCIID